MFDTQKEAPTELYPASTKPFYKQGTPPVLSVHQYYSEIKEKPIYGFKTRARDLSPRKLGVRVFDQNPSKKYIEPTS